MYFVDKTLVEVEVTATVMHIVYQNKRCQELKRHEFLIADIDGAPEQVKAFGYLLHRRIFIFLVADFNKIQFVEEPAKAESIDFGIIPLIHINFKFGSLISLEQCITKYFMLLLRGVH